ncbi:MAG: TlpA family protein disulfide reductase [Muribaculaceae bacterium]|nr:TlpA family protein disulfide reductase [Muribaculaceae bacterium]
MKKILLTAIIACVIIPLALAAKVVELPKVEKIKSGYSFIKSIELSDTATRINMSFVHIPGYWVSLDTLYLEIPSRAEKFLPIRYENYVPGVKQTMDESGRYDLTIVYPPVEASDSTINLIEILKDGSNGFLFEGVRLYTEPAGRYKAHIHGTHDRKSGFMVVSKSTAVPGEPACLIPVDNREFDYTFTSDTPVFYTLYDGLGYLSGLFTGVEFLPENEDVQIDLKVFTPGGDLEPIVSASSDSQTQAFYDYQLSTNEYYNNSPVVKQLDVLRESNLYYTPRGYELMAIVEEYPEKRDSVIHEINALGNGNVISEEGQRAEDAMKKFIDEEFSAFKIRKALEMDNLAGLYALLKLARYGNNKKAAIEAYKMGYEGRFPDHPYSVEMDHLCNSSEPVVGNCFNDFSAPDFEGTVHRLSDLVKGKPALIELWSSMCYPCRKHSMSMIPVYEEFAPKGFTIVGVAREFGDQAQAMKVVGNDGYPWINLVEIDDRNGIWTLYQIQNALGGSYLIDPDGKIVAVSPSAEEVRAYLESYYK